MAAFNFHREILEELPDCITQCDPLKNPTGNCTYTCASICPPPFCNTTSSSLSLPPLPPPLPPTDGFIFSTPPKPHHSSLSLPLKISLVILVVTFSLFLLYTLYKFYTVWYRSRRRRSPPPLPENQETTHDEFLDHDVLDHPIWYIRTIGLQPSVISAITVVKYNKTEGLIDDTYCSVCLSEFEEDETLRLLPKCNHAFHITCIDTWLRSHTNCPLCRAGIVKNNAPNSSSSSSGQNLDESGQREEAQLAISIPEEVNGEETQEACENSEFREIVGGSGTTDFLIMRRSVSLNDYAACRIRSDVHNNNYYSDRHQVQIQSLEGDLGFDLIKVEQPANNCTREGN